MKIFDFIKRNLQPSSPINPDPSPSTYEYSTEEEFYEFLFTKDSTWSKPEANHEEIKRWQIIENFIHFINGYRAAINEKGDMQILDLGCGRGWLTNLLGQYALVQGVEPIEPVVKHANNLFPNLDIKVGTSEDVLNSGRQGTFDVVVSSEVIEHIPDSEKVNFVNDINLLLKEKGFAIITTPRKEIEEVWKQYTNPNQPVEEWLTERDLENLFISNGFDRKLLNRFSIEPKHGDPLIEVYQLWLFQKV